MAAKQVRKSRIWEEKGFATAIIFILVVLVVVLLVVLIFNSYKFPL
jgi:t-SNARE complex subunit (syntaxin)